MMRNLPNCPKCGESDLCLYRAGDSLTLFCAECGWRTSGLIVAGVDIDDAIAAAVAKAKEPDEAPHGFNPGTGSLAYVPDSEPSATTLGEAAVQAASSIAMALLKRTLDEGGSIHIPSLGITIGPEPDATEQSE